MAFRESDAVLVVGTRFNWVMTFGRRINPDAKIIQIDIEPSEIGKNRSVSIGLAGDAKAVLSQINFELERSAVSPRVTSRSGLSTCATQTSSAETASRRWRIPTHLPIHPLRLCKELREVMDRDAILTVDGNEILHYGRQSIQTYEPGHRINSGPTGCMGVGLPYAIGAKLAKPDKQVVSLHGDGSLGMNIQDFDTAVRYNLPMTIVVSNNEGWTARVQGHSQAGTGTGIHPVRQNRRSARRVRRIGGKTRRNPACPPSGPCRRARRR